MIHRIPSKIGNNLMKTRSFSNHKVPDKVFDIERFNRLKEIVIKEKTKQRKEIVELLQHMKDKKEKELLQTVNDLKKQLKEIEKIKRDE
jgi:histidyl-tRNA synthetase